MFENFITGFENVLILFIFVFVGILLRKIGIVDKKFSSQLSAVLFNFFLPCLIIDVIFNTLDTKTLSQNYNLAIIALINMAAGLAVGYVLYLALKSKGLQYGVSGFASVFSNFSFMGIPIVAAIYGEEVLGLLLIYNLPFYFLVNIVGYMVMASEKKVDVKKVLNPSTIAMILGFILLALNIKLPYVVAEVVEYSSAVVSPMAMLTVGLTIGGSKVLDMLKNYKVYIISVVRLLVLPLLTLAVLVLLGYEGATLYLPVIITAMPVAANMSIIAGAINKYEEITAQIIFVSTGLSLITIPLISGIVALF